MARLLNCFEPNCVFPLQYFLTHQDLENAKKLYFFLAMIALHENMISKFPNMLVEVNQEVLQDASSITWPLLEKLLLSTFLQPPPLCLLLVITFLLILDQFYLNSSILATHLSNQLYEICIRRASGNCAICYWPALTGSFGLSWVCLCFQLFVYLFVTQFIYSVPNNVAAQSRRNQACSNDYIQVSI